MERHAFAFEISKGKKEEFTENLDKIRPDIEKVLEDNGIHNFSIWNAADLVFMYGESEDIFGDTEKVEKVIADTKFIVESFSKFGSWICRPGEKMRLMYHDFGIIRTDKSNIRIRMFMIRLKDGCAEEYKRRHDGLIEKRGGKIDPGPDSNFSIWSDGHYIFGYDEIDTTMEKEPTEEDLKGTLAWETKQLEIMDWITDDCDKLFNTKHPASVCLFKYL